MKYFYKNVLPYNYIMEPWAEMKDIMEAKHAQSFPNAL